MDSNGAPPRRGRETYIAVLICLLIGIPLFVFLNVITFGLMVLLLVVAGGLSAIGAMHYLLWGRSFTRSTAWEREEQEMRDLADAENEEWPSLPPDDRHGF